jgi:hypothetical protein
MKKIIFSIFLSVIALTARSSEIEMPEFAPRTPDVANLEKFGDYPIGYNTGTVSINVPMFSFMLGENSTLSISIGYHSSGIKIADKSGQVGAGWALNAGGCISREVRGMIDDESNGFYNFMKLHPGYVFPEYVKPESSTLLLDSIDNRHIDGEPDIFYLTLPSGNYKFFYGNDCQFHTIPYSNIKIEQTALDNKLGRGTWTVTDESGVKYIYGVYNGDCAIETSANSDTGRLTVTAWKLLAIKSADDRELAAFNYAISQYTRNTKSNVYRFLNNSLSKYCRSEKGYEQLLGAVTSNISTEVTAYELSEIVINGVGVINIQSSQNLENYCHAIDRITFTDAISSKETSYALTYDNSKRKYLIEINKETSSGKREVYRKFEYYDGLPDSYDTFAQDYWGYYNGQLNNQSLYPNTSYFRHPSELDYNDRYPNEKAICGSLKSIYYPTGGKTCLEYDNNSVLTGNNVTTIYNCKQAIMSCSLDDTTTESPYFTHIGNVLNTNNTSEQIKIKISYALHPAGLYTGTYKLVDLDGNTIFEKDDLTMSYSATKLSGTTTEGYTPFEYTLETNIKAGTYKWIASYEINTPKKNVAIHPVDIKTTYYTAVKSEQPDERAQMVGGIRIKSITNYDADGAQIEKKSLRYVTDKGESSGSAGPNPIFVRYYLSQYTHNASSGAAINGNLYVGIEEVGGENLCRYTGSAVLYSQVIEETELPDQTKYITKYYYQNAPISYPDVSANLFYNQKEQLTFGESGYREGLLINTIADKTTNNSAYEPAQKTKNYRTILESKPDVFIQKGVSVQNIFGSSEEASATASDKYYCGTYDLISAKIIPTQTEVYQFLEGDSIVQTTKYVYSNYNYLFPTETATYTNSSNPVTSKYKYCFDYSDDSSMNMLLIKNILSNPVYVETTYNDRKESVDTKYRIFQNTLVKPSVKKSIVDGDTIKVDFSAYDSYGNLQQATLNDFQTRFYIWSYDGKLPIAEITGGGYTFEHINSAVYSVFGLSIDDLSSVKMPDITKLKSGALQRKLPNANVVTFTYDNINCVATITDTNGLSNIYEYDDFDRLVKVVCPIINTGGSVSSAIAKSYQYNYKGITQ